MYSSESKKVATYLIVPRYLNTTVVSDTINAKITFFFLLQMQKGFYTYKISFEIHWFRHNSLLLLLLFLYIFHIICTSKIWMFWISYYLEFDLLSGQFLLATGISGHLNGN